MPYIETPADIAEDMANQIGVYGAAEEHGDDCSCRVCFVIELTARIRQSVEHENMLYCAMRTAQ